MRHQVRRTKLSITIDTTQYKTLLRIAAKHQLSTGIKCSIHDVIRMALDQYIQNAQPVTEGGNRVCMDPGIAELFK